MTDPFSPNVLLAVWQRTLAAFSPRPALFSDRGKLVRTFAEIESEARDLQTHFGDLEPHSVVGLEIGNSPSWPAWLLALWRARLIPFPLGGHLSTREKDAALDLVGASLIIERTTGQHCLDEAAEQVFPRRCEGLEKNVVQWLGTAPDFLKLTSGTTSQPRVIRFRAEQLLADAENICAAMRISADDLNFGVIPFSHSYGFSNLLLPLLIFGVPLVASEERLPRALWQGIRESAATVFPATPLFFQKLAELEDARPLPHLRLCISAGAPLPSLVAEKFRAKYGQKIHSFYGSSECGGIAFDGTAEPAPREGFLGRPLPGVQVTAWPGRTAAIRVQSAAVGDGYFPPEDSQVLQEGCFTPGDLIQITTQGLIMNGRASDVINVAGRKLNPLEVEARLAEFPGVKQAVVFGVASTLRGEEPVACIAGDGVAPDALLRFCRERLSAWQIPRDLWMVREIPANERGKISRRELAQSYQTRDRQLRG